MKKILAILFLASLLLACNSSVDKKHSTETSVVSDDHEHDEKGTELQLNSGAKWKADSTTIVNTANLQTIISVAKKNSLEEFLQTSKALQDGLNKMVKECTMQGADHDALHIWLKPLIKNTKELSKTSSIENATHILQELETQMNLFPQYFQK